jgi:uncharacterized membrane protein (UPF0127 family)
MDMSPPATGTGSRWRYVILVAVALSFGSCGAVDDPLSNALDMNQLEGFEVIQLTVDGDPLSVALADTPALRRQGLRGVEDLGEVAGMWFTWGGAESTSAFTMQDTLIELDIAFFDADGEVVDVLTMVPCSQSDCPLYRASRPYVAALEVPADGPIQLDARTVVAPVP